MFSLRNWYEFVADGSGFCAKWLFVPLVAHLILVCNIVFLGRCVFYFVLLCVGGYI